MWILYAFLAALFAGLTSILAKIGITNTDSHVATALRTIVIFLFAWLMVFITGSFSGITTISQKSLTFLILSGLTTGASWICYFKALQIGDVHKVIPIDKSSTILTMVLAFLILKEPLDGLKVISMILIGLGIYLMIGRPDKKDSDDKRQISTPPSSASLTTRIKQSLLGNKAWLIYALLSALFASLTSILGKIGVENVDSNLATAIRTIVILVMAWLIVFGLNKQHLLRDIDKKSRWFIGLSGLATGLSWLFNKTASQNPVVLLRGYSEAFFFFRVCSN